MKKLVLMAIGVFVLSLGGTTGALMALGTGSDTTATSASDSTAAADSGHAAPVAGGSAPVSGAAPAPTPASGEHMPPAPSRDSLPLAGGVAAHHPKPPGTRDAMQPPGTPDSAQRSAIPDSAQPPARQNPLDAAERERESFRQLARIFANMKTADAAKVLAFMSDEEVQGVIEQLGVRQAAALLGALPKERAAALSRRLLHAGMQPEAAK